MSTQNESPATPLAHTTFPTAPPVRRPMTLTLAFWGAVVIAVGNIVGAIAAIAGGRASIRAYVEETLGDLASDSVSAELVRSTIDAELNTVYNTLVNKAIATVVIAVIILGCALLVRNSARLRTRFVLVLFLMGGFWTAGISHFADADALPALTVVMALMTALLTLPVVVLLFLPATSRYAAARARR